jgi:Secretion system C-terminal sorting domain
MKICLQILLLIGMTIPAAAQWSNDAQLNLSLSTYTAGDIKAESDGAGGTYIAFYKPNGSGFYDMCVQYIDNNGVKQFGPDGIILNSYPSNTATFVFNAMVDAQGNFIVCFQDQRNSLTFAAVAYKINSAGQSLWETAPGTGDGVLLGTGLSPYPCQVAEGDYVFAWNNTTNNRINYNKVSSGGALPWGTAKEVLPPTTGRTISRPQLVGHTGGNWSMVFQQRNGTVGSPTPTTLYAKKFDGDGNQLWSTTPLANYVSSSTRYYTVFAVADTTFIAYYANPAAQNRFDALLQRINADGSLPWGINGSDFSTSQAFYEMTHNATYNTNTHEIWTTCTFSNTSQSQYGIYTQRFNAATGARQLTDAAQQVFAVSANTEQQPPSGISICSDGNLMLMLYDVSSKIYAAKINPSGTLVWAGGKVVLAGTANSKSRYNFTRSVGDQAVLVWQENRGGTDNPYAQNITCAGNLGAIPIKVEYFRGTKQGGNHVLDWKVVPVNTANGIITLERSSDGRNFSGIYSITASAVRMQQPFNYNTNNLLKGTNYYRLKLTDDNGVVTYSGIVALLNSSKGFALVNITPNPLTEGRFKLNITAAEPLKIEVVVSDMAGRVVSRQTNNLISGFNAIEVNVNSLASGMYQVMGIIDGGRSRTLNFLKH